MFVGYNRLFREGLRLLVGERFNVVLETESFENALKSMQAEEMNVHLLIGDPGPQTSTELNAISEISSHFPQTKIIILASETRRAMMDSLLIKSGVRGLLSSDISATALLYSIEIVLLGERIVPTILPLDRRIAAPRPSNLVAFDADAGGRGASLSARERQILLCLVKGLPNKSIARSLGMTESTVKVHLKGLLRKLRIQNRTQAAVWALNHGFLQSDDLQVEEPDLGLGLDDEVHSVFREGGRTESLQGMTMNEHMRIPALQI
jgi:two-component system nitrate/nitrite response regulator NarL